MSSRDHILSRVKANQAPPRPLPQLPVFEAEPAVLLERYEASLGYSKARLIAADQIAAYAAEITGKEDPVVVSTVPEVIGNLDPGIIEDPLQLAGVDLAVLRGQFAVAENGAVWVSENEAVHRVLPFITQHLILVVPEGKLLPSMHEAYREMRVDETGFGVFIAGPSKTADIEQSLVIGAHGPRSLAVAFKKF